MPLTRADAVYMAHVAGQSGRFDDMVDHMKAVAASKQELTVEERDLLSLASKNAIGERRASWRAIVVIAHREQAAGNTAQAQLANTYRRKVETELADVYGGVLETVGTHLIPTATSAESKVCFLKMKGDYHRYLSELSVGPDRGKRHKTQSREAYSSASSIASAELTPTSAPRLGLELNFSVLYWEVLGWPEEACRVAMTALGDAVTAIRASGGEERYTKESTLTLQLLRDNLALWTSHMYAMEVKKADTAPPQHLLLAHPVQKKRA